MTDSFIIRIKNLFDPYKKREFMGFEIIIFKYLNKIINYFILFYFKIFNLKLLPIPTEAIGHQIFDIECFLYEKKRKKFNFKPVILCGKKYLANHFLFENYQIKKLNDFLIVRNKFLCMILFYQRNFKNIQFDTLKYQATYDYREMHDIFKKRPLRYKLSKTHEKQGEKILKKYNINIKKNFVAIHARDSSYKRYDGESCRNSNIENFKKSVEWLIKKKYQVFRLGNREMIKCSFSKKIIDITKIDFKKDKELIDLYLISKCKFLIGSTSGPYVMASAFDKPMLLVDMVPLANVLPCARRGIAMPKLYVNKKTKKIMSFREILDTRSSHLRLDIQFIKNNIKLINNSQQEIYLSTKEIFLKVKSGNFKERMLQKKFKNLLLNYNVDCAVSRASISTSFIYKHNKFL